MAGGRLGDLADVGSYELPDVGPPLIPSGPQFSPGLPAVNAAVDAWGRPAAPPDPTVLYQTKAGPITMGDLARASDIAMGFSGGGLSTKPIKAYHSSPHDFEKFDISKIGTGEGAQVYGHGLYFAENPAVSGQGGEYWRNFLSRFGASNERIAADALRAANFDRAKAIADSAENIRQIKNYLASGDFPTTARYGTTRAHYEELLRNRQTQHELLTSGKPVGPRTYEVNIHADPQTFLNWDRPIGPEIVESLGKRIPNYGGYATALNPATYGEEAYHGLARMTGKSGASRALEEAGVPGIRYLDQGSRLAQQRVLDAEKMIAASRPGYPGEAMGKSMLAEAQAVPQTSNYVVFDPSIVQIMRKYGIVGAPIGALAAQDRYQMGE